MRQGAGDAGTKIGAICYIFPEHGKPIKTYVENRLKEL